MTQDIHNERIYLAEKGMTFIRVSDNKNMGDVLWLGQTDSIENYLESEIPMDAFSNNLL